MNPTYELYKQAHLCPTCGKPAEKGRVFCEYHTRKRREAGKRAYYRNKERQKTDPEYREHIKQQRAGVRIRYRAKCKAEGRCYACGKPATHGVYCTKHWRENIEKHAAEPYKRINQIRRKLPIPPVSDKTKTDVGKLIALYNAGWPYKDIALELKISTNTVGTYVKKAKEELDGQDGLYSN